MKQQKGNSGILITFINKQISQK